MLIRKCLVSVLAGVAMLALSAPAQAEGFITPYLGVTFGTDFDGGSPGRKLHYGAAATWLNRSGLGFEVDFAYAPTFFKAGDDPLFDFTSDGNVVTLMGNVVFGRAGGGLQPYVSGGFGLMRSNIGPRDLIDYSNSGFGVNAGAGLRAGSGRLGVRADMRYFRQLTDLTPIRNLDLGSFAFWRGSGGLSIGF